MKIALLSLLPEFLKLFKKSKSTTLGFATALYILITLQCSSITDSNDEMYECQQNQIQIFDNLEDIF